MDVIINIAAMAIAGLVLLGGWAKMRGHAHLRSWVIGLLLYALGRWQGATFPEGVLMPEAGEGLFLIGLCLLVAASAKNLNPGAFPPKEVSINE